MIVYLIGNELVSQDRGAVPFAQSLREEFPEISFVQTDPTENFLPENNSIIIDTVSGILSPTWFTDIRLFEETRSVSPHDYDLGFHLRFLLKLKKISHIQILGIPESVSSDEVIRELKRYMSVSKIY